MLDLKKGRECGGCTACCKSHAVASIQKPAKSWCKDCAIGIGCKRYASRPIECIEFSCAWLIGFGEDNERPDMSKVVAGIDLVEGFGDAVTINEMRIGFFEKSKLAQEWADRGVAANMPIFIVRDQGRTELRLPENFELSKDLKEGLIESNIYVRRYWKMK